MDSVGGIAGKGMGGAVEDGGKVGVCRKGWGVLGLKEGVLLVESAGSSIQNRRIFLGVLSMD